MFDLYGVDLVLNGHDHSYARGHVPIKSTVKGVSGNINTLYITSVSGPKQYEIDSIKMKNYKADGYKSDKVGEQIQFFQVIKVDDQTLTYTAYTATGNEYDKAIITKNFKTGFKTYQ